MLIICVHMNVDGRSQSQVLFLRILYFYFCICMCTCMQVPTEVKKGFEFYGAGVIGSCEALDVMLEAELGSNSKHA